MLNFTYPAKIEQDEAGFFLVTFRDISFAVTEGKTFEEALEQGADCLSEALASCVTDCEEIPRPSEPKPGEHMITPTALIAAKAALYIVTREEGLNKSTLSSRIGVSEAVGRRLLDPRHQTKIVKIDQAMQAMGKRMVIGIA